MAPTVAIEPSVEGQVARASQTPSVASFRQPCCYQRTSDPPSQPYLVSTFRSPQAPRSGIEPPRRRYVAPANLVEGEAESVHRPPKTDPAPVYPSFDPSSYHGVSWTCVLLALRHPDRRGDPRRHHRPLAALGRRAAPPSGPSAPTSALALAPHLARWQTAALRPRRRRGVWGLTQLPLVTTLATVEALAQAPAVAQRGGNHSKRDRPVRARSPSNN